MQKYRYIAIATLIALAGCGRKTKNFYSISKQAPHTSKINKLSLPIVRNPHIDQKTIIWSRPKIEDKKIQIVGYNIYKFARNSFVQINPINKEVVKREFFKLEHKSLIRCNMCYIVRALFKIENQVVEGPASKIICV